jgi:hypothetical protein
MGPPLAIAQPQQQVAQQPAAQPQQLYPPIALPYIPPLPPVLPAQPPAAAAAQQLPPPLIVVTPPPQPFTPIGRKRHRFEAIPAIPEEDEEDEPLNVHRPRLADPSPSPPASTSSDSTDNFNTPPSSPNKAERKRGTKGEDPSSAFGRLAVSADADLRKRRDEIRSDARGEGAPKIPGSSKFLQHGLAEAGPPSQRTRQMEKELEKTLLKRYGEAKALEKKKKKEKAIKKEPP